MIELTGRKYAAPWTVEDGEVFIHLLRRRPMRMRPRMMALIGDKADADIMLAAMKEKPRDNDPAS